MDDYLELLNRYDEGVEHLDMPADRSIHFGLTEDIKRLQTVLREELGLEFKMVIKREVEKAWFGDLWVEQDDIRNHAALTIRVSNFGRLATIIGFDKKTMDRYPVEKIRRYITKMDFRCIPIEVLELPYGGFYNYKSYRPGGESIWFDRFFSYQ